MSLPVNPRGLLRHIDVQPTRTGKNAGRENHQRKRPARNKLKPAFPSPCFIARVRLRTSVQPGRHKRTSEAPAFFRQTGPLFPTEMLRVSNVTFLLRLDFVGPQK